MSRDEATLPSPAVAPGQVCIIEHDPQTALAAPHRAVLTAANVVLYDRALERLVTENLLPGGYAEPLPFIDATPSPRALGFAADGWSVVQLIAARPGRGARLYTGPAGFKSSAARTVAPAYAFTANGLAG